MFILPAIDLVGGKVVRLLKGDYDKMTVYSDDPLGQAVKFRESGAKWVHIVDLEGAKSGETPNIETIKAIAAHEEILTQVGGGIRNMKTAEIYANAGVDRMVLGTAAVKDPAFLKEAVANFKDMIAVGVDIKDSYVAINGWTEKSEYNAFDFCKMMQDAGVRTIICTDISRDGAMRGTNLALYKGLVGSFDMNIIASGGVSSLNDVKRLNDANVYGAIIGKACYTGAVDVKKAVELADK